MLRGFELADAKIEAAYANPVSTVPIAYNDLVCTFSQDIENEVIGSVERFGAISAGVCVCLCVACLPVCVYMCAMPMLCYIVLLCWAIPFNGIHTGG